MMQQKKVNYIYDPATDCLNVYLATATHFYSDEEQKGIYKIYNEETDDLIGIEIMYYSVRNKEQLSTLFPNIDFESIEKTIH